MRGYGLQSLFADAMGAALGPDFPSEIGLAVSGGGDSMAMLALAHNWTREFGVTLRVVTVDHGLRPESASEAAFVARECAALGHSHETLTWNRQGVQGNLQEAARTARLQLIDGWRGTVRHVLMAHTADDQAETVLMRLARGSGVDGLAAMAHMRPVPGRDGGFYVVRPLLDARRADLRHYLTTLKGSWIEDPSNEDARFDRVRMRKALEVLEPLGLAVDRLTETATRMARAREALRSRAQEAADKVVRAQWGDLLYDRDALAALDEETRQRLLAAGLMYVSGQVYRPRAKALDEAAERALSGGAATLHGCLLRAEKADLRVCREHRAVAALRSPVGALWDGRVRVTGRTITGLTVRALGEDGASQLPQRPEGLPFQSLVAQCAVFDGDRLVAFAPAGFGPEHDVDHAAGQGTFRAFLHSH